jgi:hypothetical protein
MSELYPGRSVITCEMLAAWKDRNFWLRLALESDTPARRLAYFDRCDAHAEQLLALRRVWRALRAAR